MLKSIGIVNELRDVGHAESEPDILIKENGNVIPVECKTKDEDDKSISSSEAFDIFGKGLAYNKENLVTVGKPRFSQSAIDKGHKQVTLLLHICLVEMIIKVWENEWKKEDVMEIIKKGGYIKIEQISPEISEK